MELEAGRQGLGRQAEPEDLCRAGQERRVLCCVPSTKGHEGLCFIERYPTSSQRQRDLRLVREQSNQGEAGRPVHRARRAQQADALQKRHHAGLSRPLGTSSRRVRVLVQRWTSVYLRLTHTFIPKLGFKNTYLL